MNAKKKLVVVVMVLMMMVTAVAYAAWSDTIQVNGRVQTGTFDVQWSDKSNLQQSAVGEGSITVTRQSDVDVLKVDIANAKPGDTYSFTTTSENVGELSAVYDGLIITDSSIVPTSGWVKTANIDEVNFKIDNTNAYSVKAKTIPNTTLDPANKPGNKNEQNFEITVTILDSANQNTSNDTGSFYVYFNYVQQAASTYSN